MFHASSSNTLSIPYPMCSEHMYFIRTRFGKVPKHEHLRILLNCGKMNMPYGKDLHHKINVCEWRLCFTYRFISLLKSCKVYRKLHPPYLLNICRHSMYTVSIIYIKFPYLSMYTKPMKVKLPIYYILSRQHLMQYEYLSIKARRYAILVIADE